jgi:hypothetical protein
MTDFRQLATPIVNALAALALSVALIAGTVSTPRSDHPAHITSTMEYAA